MKKLIVIRGLILLSLSVLVTASFSVMSFGEEGGSGQTVSETSFSYDIMVDSDGKWTGERPGDDVCFSRTAGINPLKGRKLVDVDVSYFDANPLHRLYSMSVKKADITVTGFTSSTVSFNVRAGLEANVSPGEIKRFRGGACFTAGYRYYFPLIITLYYEGYDKGSGEAEAAPSAVRSGYLPKAEICMPSTAYQNHPVILQDMSIFSQGEDFYPAYLFYKKGYGTNCFRVLNSGSPVDVSRINTSSSGYYSDREAVFSQPGTYTVSLAASVNGGETGVDTGQIKILPVPDASAALRGERSAFSVMTLDASIVLDPEVNDYTADICIRTFSGSEKAVFTYSTKTGFSSPENSENIKLNTPVLLSENKDFSDISVDFLIKDTNQNKYVYEVKVTDSEGKSSEYKQVFAVKGREIPSVVIKGDSQYMRSPGTNEALIRLSDASGINSANAERTWYLWKDNGWTSDFEYTDLSLGSGKTIEYRKEGCGKVRFMLKISMNGEDSDFAKKYISSDDVAEGSAVFEAEVINSPPVVSLSEIRVPDADLLLIYDDDHESEALSQKSSIEAALAEAGINGEVNIQKVSGYSDDEAGYGQYHVLESPFSYHAESYSYDKKNYISDSKRLYKVGASFGRYGGGSYIFESTPASPYTVTACDMQTGEVDWEISFTSNDFSLTNSFAVNQDDCEKYLYLSNSSKTLVLDKNTGKIVTVISAPVGRCYITDRCIYSFTSKEIREIDLSTGSSNVLYTGELSGDQAYVNGKLRFCAKISSVLRVGEVDTETGQVSINNDFSAGGAKAELTGFDALGNMIVFNKTGSSSATSSAYYYSPDLELLNTIVSEKNVTRIKAVKDTCGVFRYIVFTRIYLETSPVETKVNKYSVYDISKAKPTAVSAKLTTTGTGYLTASDILWARTTENGVRIITDCNHSYNWTASGTHCVSTVSCAIDVDMENGKSSYVTCVPEYTTGQGNYFDSSYVGEDSVCLQYTFGNPVNDGISGSSTVFLPIRKSLSSMIDICVSKNLKKEEGTYNGVFIMAGGKGHLTSDDTLRVYFPTDGSGLNASVNDFINFVISKGSGGDSPSLVYEKGEKINIKSIYRDYEGDPSKKSCYVYYHYPYNDGPNPDVNYITDSGFNVVSTQTAVSLDEPLTQFRQDGMYKVEHWQYDSTGDPSFDKKSNVASMIFYIRSSEDKSSYPSVGSITVNPSAPREGQAVDVTASVSDPDGDTLTVTLSAYNGTDLVKEETFTAEGPDYRDITMRITDSAAPGRYTVICTVSDGTHTVSDSKVFAVTSGYTVTAGINHTEQWDTNRKKYNLYLFGNEGNDESDYRLYSLKSAPRERGTNVFWTEEKLVLQASVTGNPTSVVAELEGTGVTGELTKTGQADSSGVSLYSGSLWSSSLKGKYGRNAPKEMTVSVTAYYSDGSSVKTNYNIIYDDSDDYWRVHRLY